MGQNSWNVRNILGVVGVVRGDVRGCEGDPTQESKKYAKEIYYIS